MGLLTPSLCQQHEYNFPEDPRPSSNSGSVLGHRLRRWPNIKPELGECLIFAVILQKTPVHSLSKHWTCRPVKYPRTDTIDCLYIRTYNYEHVSDAFGRSHQGK